ncbi:FAD-dependent monooxygenase [Nocardia sp. NPDC006630]|uniref:FAD-dependent monooxygenase n=1 Tax=Nocardia sp. NPDC006630 TaxID=3157181 RepID=UPI0033A2B739
MQTPVLVVGGGPAGLVAALGLTRRGVGVRLLERAEGPSVASRAKGLQPRTLEMLEQLGVLEEILAAGGRFPRWRSYRSGELAWEKSIYELLGTGDPVATTAIPYPETWMVAQWRTEDILRRALSARGVEVEYGSALDTVDQDGDSVTATIRRSGGSEQIRASYVVAADGAASTVRGLLGISFDGRTREDERFLTADVRTADLDREFWHNWSKPDDPAARVSICPLPGTDTFQFVAPLAPDEIAPELTLPTLQRLFEERSGDTAVRFTDAPWITLHRTNERLASRFRDGRVFLVGDAAHAVPAAGGQGLNTAVQDSHNLTWKLAAVLDGAPAQLLDSYEEERRPIAARLMAGLSTADEHGETPDIFQLRNNYRARGLSAETRTAPGGVRAGDRAPDGPLKLEGGAAQRVFDLLRDAELTCLTFGSRAAGSVNSVARHHHSNIKVQVLEVPRNSPATADILQATYDVTVGDEIAFLVRPDGYIGFAADNNIAEALHDYLSRLLGGSEKH